MTTKFIYNRPRKTRFASAKALSNKFAGKVSSDDARQLMFEEALALKQLELAHSKETKAKSMRDKEKYRKEFKDADERLKFINKKRKKNNDSFLVAGGELLGAAEQYKKDYPRR